MYSTKSCKNALGELLGEMPAGYDDFSHPDGVNSRGLTPRITSYNPIDETEEGSEGAGGGEGVGSGEGRGSGGVLVNFGTRDSLSYLGVEGVGGERERLSTGEFHGEDLSGRSGRESFDWEERSFADTGKKGDWNLALEG